MITFFRNPVLAGLKTKAYLMTKCTMMPLMRMYLTRTSKNGIEIEHRKHNDSSRSQMLVFR